MDFWEKKYEDEPEKFEDMMENSMRVSGSYPPKNNGVKLC